MEETFKIPFGEEKLTGAKLIVLLDSASLELTRRSQNTLELLNNVDHRGILRKNDRDPSDVRPDILHQSLLMLQDSPLNRAGQLLVYIRTSGNELIEVSPQLSVPRTWNQFGALMITLLQKQKIKAVEKNVVLLKTMKNDISRILPAGGYKIGFSANGPQTSLREYVKQFKETTVPVTVVIGAVAHADPAPLCDFLDDCISISSFELTAGVCCGKVCHEFERLWGIT